MLVEEFTTEKCINCPRVASLLHTSLHADNEYNGRVSAVCHHAGYYEDKFTLQCDEEMLWLYDNGGNTYAPAVMINRKPYFENNGKKTVLFIPGSSAELTEYYDGEMAITANAAVGVSATLNDNATSVTASVNCLRNDNLLCTNPHLTVYLTEDDIETTSQIGADGIYMQQHVIRAYNSTWGVPVEWDGKVYSYDVDFDLQPSWNINNLKLVAVLANYDGTDVTNCVVENSHCCNVVTGSTPVGNALEDAPCVKQIFNAGGVRISKLQQGINIMRYSDGSVRKVYVK